MTDQYAVIGNPIGHTKSPLIHGLFAEATQQAMSYVAIEGPLAPDDGFANVVREFAANGGKGMNVTAPFKLKAFALADARSERAALAGAANALKFEHGRIIAENFDGIGLLRALLSGNYEIADNLDVLLAAPALALPLMATGAVAAWFLVRRQRSQPAPLVPLDLLRIRAVGTAVAASVCGFASWYAAYLALPGQGSFDLADLSLRYLRT